jgi:hypothetical protein
MRPFWVKHEQPTTEIEIMPRKPFKLSRYVVNGRLEEFCCHVCGMPVGHGERAFEVQCNEREAEFSVCSRSCNDRDLKNWERLNEPDMSAC